MNNTNRQHPLTTQEFMDSLIRLGLLVAVSVLCFRIFSPFVNLMLWALILGVTLDPLNEKIADKLGISSSKAVILLVLSAILLLIIPAVILGNSLVQELTELYDAQKAGTLAIRPPNEAVADWPIIGERVYSAWNDAASNMPAFVEANETALKSAASGAMATAKSIIGDIFLFIGALIVAGVMMAYGEGGSQAMAKIFSKLAGEDHGAELHDLSVKTTRSVAVGVLGVAVIQALIMGIGLVLAGVPMPGVLTLIVLLLAIMQLPGIIIGLPVILWLWNSGDAGTAMNVVWTVYIIAASLMDNILKPLLLGRGVNVPMPVVLLGALGGMVSAGFIGLFIGAVVLSVGYQIFMKWVEIEGGDPAEEQAATEGRE